MTMTKVGKDHVLSGLALGVLVLAFSGGGNAQPLLPSADPFVLLAQDKITLAKDITVSSGDVGVNGGKGTLTVGP